MGADNQASVAPSDQAVLAESCLSMQQMLETSKSLVPGMFEAKDMCLHAAECIAAAIDAAESFTRGIPPQATEIFIAMLDDYNTHIFDKFANKKEAFRLAHNRTAVEENHAFHEAIDKHLLELGILVEEDWKNRWEEHRDARETAL